MKKNKAQEIVKVMPDLFSNVIDYFKDAFSSDRQKELFENANGTLGILIKLFGKPLLDKYFDSISTNRLKDYGFVTYTKASFKNAGTVLQNMEVADGMPTLDIPAVLVEKQFFQQVQQIEKTLTVLVFQPKYHPAVVHVKKSIIIMLNDLGLTTEAVKVFQKEFNDSIEGAIISEFGEDYEAHKKEIGQLLFHENETELLLDIIEQNRIGFTDSEDLKYEQAYGSWMPISKRGYGNEESIEQIVEFEKRLQSVDRMIDEYFNVDPANHIEKILFLVADFGKGKSVFLKYYAAKLAQNYLETGEGYFPIYFNLRNYSSFNNDTQFGIIEDFLQTKYAIKINNEYFKSKRYFFLIDSLDESCDLSKSAVDKVINSIKRIQSIDKSLYRTNKILITSRPFDESLFSLVNSNKPFIIKKDGKDIPHYISLYGFKKDQFNDWIYASLKNVILSLDFANADKTIKEILGKIKEGKSVDIYSLLIENGTLTSSELRRPIFGYMVYRLLQNNINITTVGKVGIYLSFLNLLSKEAKYIHDPSFKIKTQEQFEARNILHQIAALWTFERQQGRQGHLKKADICRLIGGYGTDLSDEEVIERNKKNGADIQFLSHSYFGENDSILHFQHQSFAEILLAEYYIKVLIKCALDRTVDIDFVISKLKIGIPTPQTIDFFREILKLLKDCSVEVQSNDVIEKRNLLIPLLASISIVNNNRQLHSDQLYFQWYELGNIDKDTTEVPSVLATNWCINKNILDRIIDLCEQIVLSEKVFVLSKSNSITSLIEKEITNLVNKQYESTLNLEKELAIIAGNALFNDKDQFFIRKFNSDMSIDLITKLNSEWMKSEFIGIVVSSPRRPIIELRLMGYNLCNSIFRSIALFDSSFFRCELTNAHFENVMFSNFYMSESNISNSILGPYVDFSNIYFDGRIILPSRLAQKIRKNLDKDIENFESRRWRFAPRENSIVQHTIEIENEADLAYVHNELKAYFSYCIKMKYLTKKDIYQSLKTKNLALNRTINALVKSL